ncbi:hypothetical protein P3S67_027886 [Capsicum chacoense]
MMYFHRHNTTYIFRSFSSYKEKMSVKFSPILATLLEVVAIVLLHVSDARSNLKEVPHWVVRGWNPITNLTGKVVELAKFAVDKHNKEAKTKLEYQKITKGVVQVYRDKIYYRLIVVVKDEENTLHNYLAKVWFKLFDNTRNLISFKECDVENRDDGNCNI